MKALWGRLSLRARLASAFGLLAAGALVFFLAIVARTLGPASLTYGKILPGAIFVLAAFFIGGWHVAGWCLSEISRLGSRINEEKPHLVPVELEGLAALLRKEARKRDELLEELRRFTADASHELRTPLTALRSVGEVALRARSDDPTQLREAIGSMLEEAQRMNALVGRLLRLARLESDAFAIQFRRVQLDTHLTVLCDSVAVLAEEKNVQISITCPRRLAITTDIALLGHAVINLLHNAITYAPPTSIVRISVKSDDAAVAIEISDEGPGIPVEHHARIFERFYRVNDSFERKSGGFGLGLCIAKTSIDRLGGAIAIVDGLTRGAVFRITLPAHSQGKPVQNFRFRRMT